MVMCTPSAGKQEPLQKCRDEHGSQQPHETLQAWGRVPGKLHGGKGPGSVGQQ